jgi:hypothetical protein
MQDEHIERKQRFLREEIMEKGFDADQFTLWIDEKKEKGTRPSAGCDLEKWNLEELEDAVREFQATHAPTPDLKKAASQTSADKSELVDYSSVHSNSIPVRARL